MSEAWTPDGCEKPHLWEQSGWYWVLRRMSEKELNEPGHRSYNAAVMADPGAALDLLFFFVNGNGSVAYSHDGVWVSAEDPYLDGAKFWRLPVPPGIMKEKSCRTA